MELQVANRDELQVVSPPWTPSSRPFVALARAASAPCEKSADRYVDRYLSDETQRSTLLFMPLFGLFIVLLNLILVPLVPDAVRLLITIGSPCSSPRPSRG
jgi:hypothetical protein